MGKSHRVVKGMRLFYLSSKYRSSGTVNDFVVPLTHTLSVAAGGRFRIDQLRLGVAFMLVNASNSTIKFYDGPNLRTATLEQGQYDSQSLATTLAFVINATDGMQGHVTAVYNTVSACTILTYTPPSSHPSWAFSVVADPETFSIVLGGYTTVTKGNNTVLTFRFISTQPYDVVFLCSQKLGSSSIQGPRGNSDTLMQIVIGGAFGSVQEASMPRDVWISCSGIVTHSLDFQLEDANGAKVDNLGGEISFLLTVDDNND